MMWQPAPTAYVQIANDILKSVRLSAPLQTHLPSLEKPYMTKTEGDVLRATTLYPIHQALNAIYKDNPIHCFSENVKGGI